MVGGGAVAVDGVDRRAQHLLVVVQPPTPEFGDGDRLEAQRRRGADFELGVDLGGQLPRRRDVRTDAGTVPFAVLVVAQVPDLVAAVAADFADAERRKGAGHGLLRESSRHKTPQTAPQTWVSENDSERQKPV